MYNSKKQFKMNKNKIFAIAAIAAATGLTSCLNDETGNNNNNEPVAVRFSSGIAEVETRAYETTWAANDPVGIYMIGSSGTLTAANTLADNRQYTASAGATANFSATAANTIYYPVSGDDVKFIAYYPYSSPLTNYVLPVDVSDQSSQSAIDVLYAPAGTATYNKSSGTVALPFEHKLVKLVFTISNGSGVTEALSNGISVAISGQQTAGELDLATGTVTPGTGTAVAITASGNATVEAIVLPNTSTTGMGFTFTNGAAETFTGNIPALSASWTGGNKYTYAVTLQKAGAVITGTIAAWGAGTGGSVTAE
ncbi:hypothetical protein FACS189411_14700 [Bacteroidia bacterium]|nr:hypothetical protein FACS189411_14700 [Bacteroidia bacterium]